MLQAVPALPISRADWVRTAGGQFLDQARLFSSTTVALLTRPKAFFRDWAEGTHRSLSPFTYFAASLAIVGPINAALKTYHGTLSATPLLTLLFPYFEFVALGLLTHAFLKLIAKPHEWALSLAVAFFAGGGPAALADLVGVAIGGIDGLVVAAGIIAVNAVFIGVLVIGLAAVHGLRWWQPLLALVLADLVWTAAKIGALLVA